MLPRRPAFAWIARARPAHPNERAHPQGPAQDGWRAAESEREDRYPLILFMAEDPKSRKPVAKQEAKPEGAAQAGAPKGSPEGKAAKAPRKPPGDQPDQPKAADAPAAPAAVGAAPVAPTAAELLADDAAGKKIIKAKGAKNIASGIANILATF